MENIEVSRIVEALLFASSTPLSEKEIQNRVSEEFDLLPVLELLEKKYANSGINLVKRGQTWAFRTAEDVAPYLVPQQTQNRKLTKAAMETLAIIAYHQPITRSEIEEIRGVSIGKGSLDTLMELNWIAPKGRRRTPGRPMTWGVQNDFYDHFGLEGKDALPGITELKEMGLLDQKIMGVGIRDHHDEQQELMPIEHNPLVDEPETALEDEND